MGLYQVHAISRSPEPNALGGPGSIYTASGTLSDLNGSQIGIMQLSRLIVATDHNVPGYEGYAAKSNLFSLVCEFGSAESEYYVDTLHLSGVWKGVHNVTGMIDYDGAIMGGTGRFLGATGDAAITHTEYLPGTTIPIRVCVVFRAWVPKRPMPPARR